MAIGLIGGRGPTQGHFTQLLRDSSLNDIRAFLYHGLPRNGQLLGNMTLSTALLVLPAPRTEIALRH